MPCEQPGHNHPQWPASGPLTIERCEIFCQYCMGADAQHRWKFGWFLRRHVEKVHILHGDYSDVVLSKGWTRKEDGLARPSIQKKRAPPRSARRDNSKRIAEAHKSSSRLPLPDFSTTSLLALPSMEDAAFNNDLQTHHLKVTQMGGNDFTTFHKQPSLDIADTIEVAQYAPALTNLTHSSIASLQAANLIPQTCSLQAIESSSTDHFTATTNFNLPIDVGNSHF
ncbi:hypothetical protein LTR78_009778 [Recurvomyces mirabilis]|uniref:Uncharacterized protein n=1 Tax=Recurvomyces mirabilis TaxID=574656 RepID=A0AAE0TNY1_9PEZI|nr:hypothetical protein LTR78_009778 [Recurvomyces mirabilis]KAK5158195.1 hypothetical protein LTS14_003213 [Recurvomyces mirabilis]